MLSEIPESECSPFYQACFHDVLLMVYILTIPGDLFQFQIRADNKDCNISVTISIHLFYQSGYSVHKTELKSQGNEALTKPTCLCI